MDDGVDHAPGVHATDGAQSNEQDHDGGEDFSASRGRASLSRRLGQNCHALPERFFVVQKSMLVRQMLGKIQPR
jgi:hypothetical protein